MNCLALISASLLLFITQTSLAQNQTLETSLESYTELVHSSYKKTLTRAEALREAVYQFTAVPSVVTHEMAKEAWKHVREAYGQTEVFRFYNGPIDRDGGPEGALNSWPLDEAYIDYTLGAPSAGIIGNTKDFPVVSKELLISLNELGGETNISTGYHAIEFLLWGQDFFTAGPGQRSHTDYVDAPQALRRAEYLRVITDILIDDLSMLESEWRPGQENFRAEFQKFEPRAQLKKLLSGIIFLAGDELSGDRIYVAYDTRGQEDEHSCFSDMTHMDIQWNYWGIENVIRAMNLLFLPDVQGTPVAKRIEERMVNLRTLLASIPAPFDQAIVNEESRTIILTSVEELEALAKDLREVSVLLKAPVDY